ncbi:MFS transporter [Fluviispira vulneris]|uniref:MFS transporter n=1 Tax=Fluviispira vulneris TaxID=2763012 RepID=UPI0016441F72|nr:MFS transporter [Fluviispira vulneris]
MFINEVKIRVKLFKSQPYLLFALSGILATFGNGLIYITMSWYAYQKNNSIGSLALLMFYIWMPSIIFGPFFGVCADRYNKKYLLILSNVVRGIAVFVFAFFMLNGLEPNIYYLASVLGFFISFYMPAAIPFVKEIVPENKLVEANATVDMLYEFGTIIGMGVSGVLIYYLNTIGTLALGGAFFIISGLFNYLMKYNPINNFNKFQTKKQTFLNDYIDSLKYIARNPSLIGVYLTQMIIMVLIMTIPILLVPFTQVVLKGDTVLFARLEALISLGIFVGGFFSPILCKKISAKYTLMFLTILLSITLYIFSINDNILISYIVYFGIGVGLSSWAVVISQAQLLTSPDFQGRLQATFYSLSGIGVLLLYVLVNYKGNLISVQNFYLVESIIAACAFIFVFKIKNCELK